MHQTRTGNVHSDKHSDSERTLQTSPRTPRSRRTSFILLFRVYAFTGSEYSIRALARRGPAGRAHELRGHSRAHELRSALARRGAGG
eukprot:15951305-Heterocapsa_arctica.AAC.1